MPVEKSKKNNAVRQKANQDPVGFTKVSAREGKGITKFNGKHQYESGTGKNKTDKKQRNAPEEWNGRFNTNTKDGGDWRGNNPLQKGKKMFGKVAETEGHYKLTDGKLTKRQIYYDTRVGLGLAGG